MIIGVMGQARAGKDTWAEYIQKNYGFVRIGLADPMKRFCAEMFDFSDEQMWGDKRDEEDERYPRSLQKGPGPSHLSPRYALQTLGTEWGRDCYRDLWTEYGVRVAKRLIDAKGALRYDPKAGLKAQMFGKPITGVVFSDLRFQNEFDTVKAADGVMIRVKRPGMDGKVGIKDHPSEREQQSIPDDRFDFTVINDRTIKDYYEIIDKVMTRILGPK